MDGLYGGKGWTPTFVETTIYIKFNQETLVYLKKNFKKGFKK